MRIILLIIVYFLSTACTQAANILVLPKDKQNGYCVAKAPYKTWAGEKTITLFDENNNAITCTGKSRLIEQKSFSCKDKKYNIQLTCLNEATINLTYSLSESCREAYGIALVDNEKEYEVYMGISDEFMKTKIEEFESSK